MKKEFVVKPWFLLVMVSIGLPLSWCPNLRAADADDEQRQIDVLKSEATPAQKDSACALLKLVGTRRCVPALAALLTDQQLSHSARYALEPMAFDEASAALLDALTKTKDLLRVGIINSLAARAEAPAVPALIELLRGADLNSAEASARALGQIGGPDAVKGLRTCARNSSGALHAAAVDGLLRCANRLLASGQHSSALAIFEQLDRSGENDDVRVAAFAGLVRASGNAGLSLVLHAISGPGGPSQVAALQLARELQAPDTTRELTRLLPHLPPAVQVCLVGALAQRGDSSALPALTALANKPGPELRIPLIQAFDSLGDASVVDLLASFAASGVADEQRAARQALADLRRGDVTQKIIEQLSSGSPKVQAELARALGARGDKTAVPKLLDLAQRASGSARQSVLQALSLLVDDSQLGALVDLVVHANDPALRADMAQALNSACQRLQTQRGHIDATSLVQGIESGSTDARAALLPVCGGVTDPKVRAVLRIALHDQNPQVHSSAVRAICDTADPELLPDLLAIAQMTHDDAAKTMAIDGGVRLVTQEETVKLPATARVAALKSLMRCATRPEQKRKVLAGLGEVPDVESLTIVETALEDQTVRNEAASATVKIASALPASQAQASEAALKKALAVANDPGTRQSVQASLQQIQANADYLTNWEIAGPYQQTDKDYAALFDTVFPPENKEAVGVKWQKLSPSSDPARPWVMDLLKALGGQQCVAYARTWVHSDHEHGAVLELGSDDGVKVWLNEKQVYALNVARPLQPGSDKVNVTLRPGWNPLLLKITQNNQGWEFCARIRNADGSRLEGLRCDSSPAHE